MRALLDKLISRIRHPGVVQKKRVIRAFDALDAARKGAQQEELLLSLLRWAHAKVPLYRQHLEECGVWSSGDVNLGRFPLLPQLVKADIRAEGDALYVPDHCAGARKNTSGGTTGEPVVILQDRDFGEWGRAYKEFYAERAGYRPGKRLVKIWGSERDILSGTIGFKNKFANLVKNQVFLNSFRMKEQDLSIWAGLINEFHPHVVESYVQSLYELSRHIEENRLEVFSPQGIIVSAGTLFDFMEERIRGVFRAPLYNRYGSREVGDMACSCGEGKFLHLSMLTHYVEVVDEQNKPVLGVPGKILVTSLRNYSMPLIRYDIGDVGVMHEKTVCPMCGWRGKILESVRGRTVDVFRNLRGDLIDGEYFTHLFYFRPWVKRFQVVFDRNSAVLEINAILTDKDIPLSDRSEIEAAIHKVMDEVTIQWNCVDAIAPDSSGKFRFTIMKG